MCVNKFIDWIVDPLPLEWQFNTLPSTLLSRNFYGCPMMFNFGEANKSFPTQIKHNRKGVFMQLFLFCCKTVVTAYLRTPTLGLPSCSFFLYRHKCKRETTRLFIFRTTVEGARTVKRGKSITMWHEERRCLQLFYYFGRISHFKITLFQLQHCP